MILDTNAISAMAEADENIEKVLPEPAAQFIPVVCIGEYRAGIIRSRARKELQRWLNLLEQTRPILLVDLQTAGFYAEIVADLRKRGRIIPINDVWIAALARQYGMTILSQDRHFDEVKNVRRSAW